MHPTANRLQPHGALERKTILDILTVASAAVDLYVLLKIGLATIRRWRMVHHIDDIL